MVEPTKNETENEDSPKKNTSKIIAVIPARFGSSRLPGKPLADLGGKSVIRRTYEAAKKAVDLVIVATDDERIFKAVRKFGGEVRMTRKDHISGSDRIAEVIKDMDVDIVVNVQGDEPFINPGEIQEVIAPFLQDPEVNMTTLAREIHTDEEKQNIGVVKVVWDLNGDALYFSRSLIPYPRKEELCKWYEHVGIYAYRKEFLLKYISWAPGELEIAEGLEQLRVLAHGDKIRVIETQYSTVGAPCIDTPEDLEQAREFLKTHPDYL